jgi:hypothetical protein
MLAVPTGVRSALTVIVHAVNSATRVSVWITEFGRRWNAQETYLNSVTGTLAHHYVVAVGVLVVNDTSEILGIERVNTEMRSEDDGHSAVLEVLGLEYFLSRLS